MLRPPYGRSMKRTLSVLILLAAAVALAPGAASAASPGIVSVTVPSVVTLGAGGTPQNSAVVHAVYRSSYDGGALKLVVREWGSRAVLQSYILSWNQPCEPDPSYRCVTRVRLRDMPRVDGASLRRNTLYVVEASFESFSGGVPPFSLDPGIRIAAFWTI